LVKMCILHIYKTTDVVALSTLISIPMKLGLGNPNINPNPNPNPNSN